MVQWFNGSMVQWFNGSMVQWFNGSMVQWFNGSMVQWFNGRRLLMLIIVVNLIFPINTKALTEGKPSFITFSSFSIVSDSTLSVGDTISVQFNVTSLLEDSATVYFHTTLGMHILNNDSTFYKTRIQTDTNSTQNMEINILVDSIKYGSFTLHIISDYQSLEYENTSTFTGGVYPIAYNSVMVRNLYENDDALISTMAFAQTICPGTSNHHIKIKGKVSFLDWGEAQEFYATGNALENYPRRKSPLTTAWLFFRDPNNPNTITHPIPFNQTTGLPIEGIHYAKCIEGTNFNEEAGEFTFEFDYNPLAIGCQTNENMTVEVYIAKENEAAILTSASDHIIVSNIQNPFYSENNSPITNLKLYPYKYFTTTYTNGVPQNIDISYQNITNPYHNLNIELPWDEGSILRYSTLSREYLKDIYNNSTLEFSDNRKLTQSSYSLLWQPKTGDDPGGYYSPGTRNIVIYRYYNGKTNNYSNCKAIAHEFGHFFDYVLTNNYHHQAEGFALFLSFAANVWMHNNYGDLFTIYDDCEIGPFTNFKKDGVIFQFNGVTYNRFANITKIGVPDLNSCRFACYLWNIYDSKSDQPYSPISEWDGMANDDVEGLTEDLMNFWIEKPFQGVRFEDFNITFVANYSSDVKLQTSIQSIYNFMDFPIEDEDPKLNPPIENYSERMIGPNLAEMDYTTSIFNDETYIKFSWGDPINYYYIPFEYILKPANPELKYEYSFQNLPYAMKLFHNDTYLDTWSNLESVTDYLNTQETNWYLVHDGDDYCTFKLSTVTSNDDESFTPLIAHRGILGKKSIYNNESSNNSTLKIVKLNNQSLIINSTENIMLNQAALYDINGRKIEELLINNEFSTNFNINLNNPIQKFGKQTIYFQLIYTDKANQQHKLNYKIIK
ncbi:MAG: hypothetical protein A2X64_09225 [Ignavibacteria bacterium GWF2_33_9]|nr:MAG: hypothetical protein A2X64_09225 [Ignavibacteria bacterium GWF2_33_9]